MLQLCLQNVLASGRAYQYLLTSRPILNNSEILLLVDNPQITNGAPNVKVRMWRGLKKCRSLPASRSRSVDDKTLQFSFLLLTSTSISRNWAVRAPQPLMDPGFPPHMMLLTPSDRFQTTKACRPIRLPPRPAVVAGAKGHNLITSPNASSCLPLFNSNRNRRHHSSICLNIHRDDPHPILRCPPPIKAIFNLERKIFPWCRGIVERYFENGLLRVLI